MTTTSHSSPSADTPPAPAESLVQRFIGPGAGYYGRQFDRLGAAPGFRLSFNPFAALLGPIWFAARHLWGWFLAFVLVEGFGLVQIMIGLFGDRGREQHERAESILRTLTQRRQQVEEAISGGSSSVDALKRAVLSLEGALADAQSQAALASGSGLSLVLTGLVIVLGIRMVQAAVASWTLERRFMQWRSDIRLPAGRSWMHAGGGAAVMLGIVGLCSLRFARPNLYPLLLDFPTDRAIRVNTGDAIKGAFDWAKHSGENFFGAITLVVRSLLDGLETLLVGTPWPVIMLVVGLLAWLSAGRRTAIFALAALSYLGVLGFWDKAMTTVSLLGAAALVSVSLGVPLGIYCARRPRVFAVVRPILDFMQSMPSFVYLIPVVAFFGAGKPAAIVATLIFGSPPVVRMTVLGLQQVPETVREAAMAFGATSRYLLLRVDLPLASRTIMAGVNQTILLSLAMVVVASLIGAKGLGEDVLESLQYASEGQGILAGLAILCCALILDRIVQGRQPS